MIYIYIYTHISLLKRDEKACKDVADFVGRRRNEATVYAIVLHVMCFLQT